MPGTPGIPGMLGAPGIPGAAGIPAEGAAAVAVTMRSGIPQTRTKQEGRKLPSGSRSMTGETQPHTCQLNFNLPTKLCPNPKTGHDHPQHQPKDGRLTDWLHLCSPPSIKAASSLEATIPAVNIRGVCSEIEPNEPNGRANLSVSLIHLNCLFAELPKFSARQEPRPPFPNTLTSVSKSLRRLKRCPPTRDPTERRQEPHARAVNPTRLRAVAQGTGATLPAPRPNSLTRCARRQPKVI
jgi:hypothetical protein